MRYEKIYKSVKYITVALLALSLTNCNDDLTTRSSVDVDEEVILSSTTGLNMALRSAYHYALMGGEDAKGSQNDICYAGVSGLATWFDASGADIVCFKNYGGSQEDANFTLPTALAPMVLIQSASGQTSTRLSTSATSSSTHFLTQRELMRKSRS